MATKEEEERKKKLREDRAGGSTYDPEKLKFKKVTPEERADVLRAGEGRESTQAQRVREEEEAKLKQENLRIAEETGGFEERPERVELDVTEEERKEKPMTLERLQRGTNEFLFGNPIQVVGDVLGWTERDDYEINDLIQNPETLRATMLQEIQRVELDKSKTSNQKLGALLEPYLGDLKVVDVDIGGYADKWVRMPKKEAELIVEQISEMESSVSGMTDSASQGEIGNPAEVMRDIAEKEETLSRYEARIKSLILESDELKANPEQVNLIEEKILSARETFFEAKQRALEGALITPTDSQLYLKLKKLKNSK